MELCLISKIMRTRMTGKRNTCFVVESHDGPSIKNAEKAIIRTYDAI